MSQLDSSWNLEERLKNIETSQDLKNEILKYIELEHNRCTGKRQSISNLVYRGNLHYIEDNINSSKLFDELKALNDHCVLIKKSTS